MKPSCHHDATIMQPSCNHTDTCAMLRRHLRRLRRRRAGARMPVPSPAPAPKRGENVGLDLDRRAGKYQNRSVIRGMRILLTTSDPIFLLPPTHPSRSCGSTAHARAWSWAGLRLVRAARGFDGVGVGVKSPQRHSSLASQGKCHETISMCHGAPRETRQRTRARVARTLAAPLRTRLAATLPPALLAERQNLRKTNQHSTPSRDPTSSSPFEGPFNGVPSLRGVSPSRASLPVPPSRDCTTESPPFEEFPLRGLPFPFPLRGTVQQSPLPSRSFPFEGFPSSSPFEGR